MNKKIQKKLSKYSSVTGAFVLVASSANAAVIYTDVNPDVTVIGSGTYNLDLNNDLTADFSIEVSSSSFGSTSRIRNLYAGRIGYSGNNAVARNASYYGALLNTNVSVNASLAWAPYRQTLARSYFRSSSYSGSMYTYSSMNGPWLNATDKFIGLRFEIAGQTHYGWARLDTRLDSTGGEFTIKDYAYESFSGVGILTGDTGGPPADSTTALTLADNSDNYNSSDFLLGFTKAANEAEVSEYRVVLVPTADVPGFTLNDAIGAPTSGYYSITPNGTNFSDTLRNGLTDYNGVPIVLDSNYQAFIVSVPAAGFGYNISAPSNPTALSSPPPTEVATNLIINDIADNKDGSDLQLMFDKAQDESTVSEYRVIIVPKTSLSSMDLNAANSTPEAFLTKISPTGSNITEVFNASTLDFLGASIVENKAYHAFVLSVGTNLVAGNALSAMSNELTLETVVTPPPSSIADEYKSQITLFNSGNNLTINNNSDINTLTIKIYSSDGKLLVDKWISNKENTILVPNYKGIAIVNLWKDDKFLFSEKSYIH